MAKITHEKSNTNVTPKGTMPKDKLAQFKLSGNMQEPNVLVSHRRGRKDKRISRSVREISTYRMFVHGVRTHKLPSCLRMAAHYFLVPMSRSDSDNPRDRDRGSAPILAPSAVSPRDAVVA